MPAFVNRRFGQQARRRHDGVLLRFEEIEERLPDLRGRHHLKRSGSLMKIFFARERKFFSGAKLPTSRSFKSFSAREDACPTGVFKVAGKNLSTAVTKIFQKKFLEKISARADKRVVSQQCSLSR